MLLEQNFRSLAGFELRETEGDAMPTLDITFARFNVWNEIYSWREGEFLERIAPGAFKDTFAEREGLIKCLYNHGHDPTVGDKPLGTVTALRETSDGPVGTVDLFDSSYVRDLLPAIRGGVLGASYRFGVWSGEGIDGETWDRDPGVSAHNPKGLPERTMTRLRVAEFGPVTFPADEGTHGKTLVRSLERRFADTDREEGSEEDRAGAPVPVADTKRAETATAFAIAQRNRA